MLRRIALALTAVLSIAGGAAADEVRYYVENGVTYRETRRTEQRPVYRTTLQPTTQTVYREQVTTEQRPATRLTWTPITEYRPETFWVGRWNPFVQPYLATRWALSTRWEQKSEAIEVPVKMRQLVPETRTCQVPVVTQECVPQEVVTRVAVSGPAWTLPQGQSYATTIVTPGALEGQQIGGVARLDKDPPRYGSVPATAWRSSPPTR
ncbi:MAG: hypothetical protein ACOY3P_13505 [Planctomycetota bacterium]